MTDRAAARAFAERRSRHPGGRPTGGRDMSREIRPLQPANALVKDYGTHLNPPAPVRSTLTFP
jgi:hypothetical protein